MKNTHADLDKNIIKIKSSNSKYKVKSHNFINNRNNCRY